MEKRTWILYIILGGAAVALLFSRLDDKASVETKPAQDAVGLMEPRDTGEIVLQKQSSVSGLKADSEEDGNTEPALSDTVIRILSSDAPYTVRAKLILTLGRNLSAADVAALREFVSTPASEFSDMKPIAINSLKNDVLEMLMDQVDMPEGLGQQVVDMYNNPFSDYMWREYCLQFMGPLWEKMSEDGSQRAEDGDQRTEEINRQSPIQWIEASFRSFRHPKTVRLPPPPVRRLPSTKIDLPFWQGLHKAVVF